jgi:hypothetical protein
MVKLVVIKKDLYSFFDGRKHVVTVKTTEPISRADLESYREQPYELKLSLIQAKESGDDVVR